MVTKTRYQTDSDAEEEDDQAISDERKISAEHYMKRRKLVEGSWYASQIAIEKQTHKQYWENLLQKQDKVK